ncbi:hypothetical protein UYO_1736 [Lachnospiraceae bacterium JC7]|nr:hypothetical protein UYO_1736 [Lachnospiraceae bacterium JC7]
MFNGPVLIEWARGGKEMTSKFYTYISPKAGFDPVKTIFLLAPSEYADTTEHAEEFSVKTGWRDQAERDGGILLVPLIRDYRKESRDLLKDHFLKVRKTFEPSEDSKFRGVVDKLWPWESLIYMVGYGEGADYAGDVLVKHPNMFAGTALIDGRAHDFSAGEMDTDHWFQDNCSDDYRRKNKEVPSCLFLLGKDNDHGETASYFRKTISDAPEDSFVRGTENFAPYVQEDHIMTGHDPYISDFLMHHFFNHVARWDNAPDGTLQYRTGQEDFYRTPAEQNNPASRYYWHGSVEVGSNMYHYVVYLPMGMNPEEAEGLSVVFSIHEEGVPASLECEKNGWEELADECREFMVVMPDCPGNSWNMARDHQVIPEILKRLSKDYSVDLKKVYLSGNGQGAEFADRVAALFPKDFTAAILWNKFQKRWFSVTAQDEQVTGSLRQFSELSSQDFLGKAVEMPVWIAAGGDISRETIRDYEREVETLRLAAGNGVEEDQKTIGDEIAENSLVGYKLYGDRPYGMRSGDTREAWEFVRRFSRERGSKTVSAIY